MVTDGNPVISERGFAYGTTSNPSVEGTRIAAGKGTGIFTANLTGLTAVTIYHVRAYAINTEGVAYGSDRMFTTGAALPTLTTSAATGITAVALTSGGTITSDGGAAITARGICWNTTGTPTSSDNKTTDGNGTGTFTSSLTNLQSNAKIYIRAYATNSVGTAYGNQIEATSLRTLPSNGLVSWWPLDGNTEDASGNGNHASNSGATFSADRSNTPNNALTFDGNDFVSAKAVAFTDVSFSLWYSLDNDSNINPSNGYPPAGSQLLGQGTYFPTKYCDFSLGVTTYNSQTPQYGIEQGTVNNVTSYFADAPIGFQTWTHVACVISGTTIEIYQNGQLKATLTAATSFIRNGDVLSLGSRVIENCCSNGAAPVTNFFKGKLDDVAIWNRKLSAAEVLKIYNQSGF